MNGRYVGIAIVAVAALCFNYQMFRLGILLRRRDQRASAHLALEDFTRSITAGMAFIV